MNKNLLAFLSEEYLKNNPMAKAVDIYTKIGISRQNYYESLDPDREIRASNWKKWRLALGIPEETFWTIAKNYYETGYIKAPKSDRKQAGTVRRGA